MDFLDVFIIMVIIFEVTGIIGFSMGTWELLVPFVLVNIVVVVQFVVFHHMKKTEPGWF